MKIILAIFIVLLITLIVSNALFHSLIQHKEYYDNQNLTEPINLVFSCDKNQFVGLIAMIHSILVHSTQHTRLKFYFLVDKDEKHILEKLLEGKFNENSSNNFSINYKVKEMIPDSEILDNIRVEHKGFGIVNNLNFARFTFPDVFPELDKILYLDADMIVNEKIELLYDNCNISKTPFYAVCNDTIETSHDFKDTYQQLNLNPKSLYFNAGIYCTSLNYWRKNQTKKNIIDIMKKHKNSKKPLFKFGTQPILNLAFIDNKESLPKEWNTSKMGSFNNINKELLKKAKIYHWSGPNKPWKKKGYYKYLWDKYNL
jgi:lipopolysaccharide biosynthesis glycosyltransferase